MLQTNDTLELEPEVNAENPEYTKYQSVEELLKEMEIEREDVNEGKETIGQEEATHDAPELQPDKELETTVIESTAINETINKPKISERKARFEARFLARTNDRLHAFLCSLIANDDTGDFHAEKEEIAEIAECFYEWRKDSQEPLPLWLELAITISIIYGPLYKKAFDIRKYKKRNQELVEYITKQQEEIEQLKQQHNKQQEQKAPHQAPASDHVEYIESVGMNKKNKMNKKRNRNNRTRNNRTRDNRTWNP